MNSMNNNSNSNGSSGGAYTKVSPLDISENLHELEQPSQSRTRYSISRLVLAILAMAVVIPFAWMVLVGEGSTTSDGTENDNAVTNSNSNSNSNSDTISNNDSLQDNQDDVPTSSTAAATASPQQQQQTEQHLHNNGFDCFQSTQELITAVHAYLMASDSATSDTARVYGHPIGTWCVSALQDFTDVFSIRAIPEDSPQYDYDELVEKLEAFDEPLDGWDLSNAHTLTGMLEGAKSFNQDLSMWDVSNVHDFSHLFQGAHSFHQDLGTWNTSSATNMKHMFFNAKAFRGDGVEHWDVSHVKDMENMFQEAVSFDGDVENWDVHDVHNMAGMFRKTHSFSRHLSNWKLSPKLHSIEGMFQSATKFHANLHEWGHQLPRTQITSFKNLFNNAHHFNRPLDTWDTSKIVDVRQMFRNATDFNKPIGNWDMSNVLYMDQMFQGALGFNQDVSQWDLSSIQSMGGMFAGASSFDQNLCPWKETLMQEAYIVMSNQEGEPTEPTNITAELIENEVELGALESTLDSLLDTVFLWEDEEEDYGAATLDTTIFAGTSCPRQTNPQHEEGVFVGPFCHACT